MNIQSPHRRIPILLFLLTFFTFGYFFQSGAHNENVRLDLVRSMVEDHSFVIDPYVYNTADGIHYRDHFYSGKAPGSSFLAVPAWWLASRVIPSLISDKNTAEHIIVYLTIWWSVGLLSSLGAAFLYRVLATMVSTLSAVVLVLVYSLGTIAFPFSTLFFGHQLVASFLLISFALIYLGHEHLHPKGGSSTGGFGAFLGGICLGGAVITEYPAALVVPAVTSYAAYRLHSRSKFCAFLLGGLLMALLLAWYNYNAFGDIFFVPYSVYANDPSSGFTQHQHGILGITLPTLSAISLITFSAQRGLFVCNPVMLLLIPALTVPLFFKARRAESLLASFIVWAFFFVNAGYGTGIVYAGGGASVGPRHLIPIIPFAMVLIAYLFEYFVVRSVFVILGLPSIAIMLMATATEPRADYGYDRPVTQLFLKSYQIGRFAHLNSGTFNNSLMTEDSVAFNLGKLAKLPRLFQLAPLFCFWILALYLLSRECRRSSSELPEDLLFPIGCGFILILALFPILLASYLKLKNGENSGLQQIIVNGDPWAKCEDEYTPRLIDKNNLLFTQIAPSLSVWNSEDPPPFEAPFSSELTGSIEIPMSGSYLFLVRSDDGACFYLDNHLVQDNWSPPGIRESEARLNLESGKHNLNILYKNVVGAGQLEILWAPISGKPRPIPPEYLTHVVG